MNVDIYFNLVHPNFRNPLRVKVEWKFPFLPRIGESVNAWVWIEGGDLDPKEVEEQLTSEGQESRNSEIHKNYSINDWLYEVGMECDMVYDISYYKEDSAPSGIYIEMYLNDTGVYHR